MQISSANLNVDSTILVDRVSVNNVLINSQSIGVSGTQIVNGSQISRGTVSLTPSGFSTPSLFIGGSPFGPETTMGVVNAQFFTANGTWTKPTSANNSDPRNQVLVMIWAGGGGAAGTDDQGGGGGACVIAQFPLSNFGDTETVVVGPGGVGRNDGGNSSFGSIVAYGGGRTTSTQGGGGGGLYGVGGAGGVGGGPLGGAVGNPGNGGDSTFGGGGPTGTVSDRGGRSIFGGGGGTGRNNTTANIIMSVFGGAGGAANSGVSLSSIGGNGANSTVAASTPGGGGCSSNNINGARGEVRVWVIGPGPLL